MKKEKILFWSATTLIALFEGLMPILTFNTDMAKDGIRHLGYPDYFGTALVVFQVLGALALIVPILPQRFKEWAYAGFFFLMSGAIFFFFLKHDAAIEYFGPSLLLVLTITSWYFRPSDRTLLAFNNK